LYDFAMPEVATLTVFYPPQPSKANKVGQVEVTRGDSENIVHRTFLGEPFGKDIVVAGRFLRERRTEWAANRAYQKILFQAEGQLGSELHDHIPSDPDTLLYW
jgi:hypothetical protein